MVRPVVSRNAPVPAPQAVQFARLALLALAAAALAASAWWRPIDGDEGYYAAAADLTAAGAAPYTDYFYPQAPALPWLYAPVVKLGGPNLRLLRGFSAVLAFGAVLVWSRHFARRYRREPWLGVAAVALLACAPGVISWSVTVKTYAATGLLVSVALLALRRGCDPGGRLGWLLAAGAAFGLAGSIRLFFVPLAPVLALGLVVWPGAEGRRRAVTGAAGLLAGFTVGSLPLLVTWLQDPAVFVFNNLGYHALRFSALRDLHPDPTPLVRLGAAVTGAARVVATNPYLCGFLVLAGLGLGTVRTSVGEERRYLKLVGLITGVFLLGCMAPDPVYDQYFTAPLATLALPLAAAGLGRVTRARPQGLAVAAGCIAAAAALVLGLQRPGMDPDPVWNFDSYTRVTREIRQRSGPGEMVFSFWPGYVFGADRRFFPGMENQFALGVSEKLTPAEKARYRIADRQRLMDGFRMRTPRLVVLGTWMNEVNTALDDEQMRELLTVFQGAYEIVAMHGAVKICAPQHGP